MVLAGALILVLLGSFIVSVIVVVLQLLAVIVGIILVLGGIAMFLFGHRFGRRRPWEGGPAPART